MHLPVLVAALAVSVACGGGDQQTADTAAPGAPAAGTPAGGAPAAGGDFTPQQVTAQMIALGDSIFRGQAAGGICYTCHGTEAEGSQLGPNLTDQEWIHGDGSLPFIVNTVRNGILQPQTFPGVMPPFGTQFSEDQIRAVAAYVYSKSHPDFRPGGGD